MIAELGWSTPFLALAAASALAVAMGGAGLVSRRRPTISSVVWAAVVAAAALVAYLSQSDGWEFDVADAVIGALAGAGFGLAAMFAVRAVAAGSLSVVAPITAVVALALPYMVGLALGQDPRAQGMFGLLLALGAATMMARDDSDAPTESESKPNEALADSGAEPGSEPEAKADPSALTADGGVKSETDGEAEFDSNEVLAEGAAESGPPPDAEPDTNALSAEGGSESESEPRTGSEAGDSNPAAGAGPLAHRPAAVLVDGLADGAVLAALAGVAGGVGLVLIHGTAPESGATPLVAAALMAAVSVLALATFTRRLEMSTAALIPAVVPGVAAAAAGAFYLEAVESGPTSVAAGLTASFAVILWLVGVTVLRERVSGDRWLAVVLAVGAVVLLSLAISQDPVARNSETDADTAHAHLKKSSSFGV